MVDNIIVKYIIELFRIIDHIFWLSTISYRYVILVSFSILSLLICFTMLFPSIIKIKKVRVESYRCSRTLPAVFSTAFILSLIKICSSITVFGVDVGEHSRDVLYIYKHGHWSTSFKNPYYDLINVPALLRVVMSIILGIYPPHSVINATIISLAISICFITSLFGFMKKSLNIKTTSLLFLLAYIGAISNPYVYTLFTSSHYMGLSFLLSILSVMVTVFHSNIHGKLILSCVLYLGSLLAHGISILFVLPLALYIIYDIRGGGRNSKTQFLGFGLHLGIILVMVLIRIIYTTAHRGFLPYLSEFLGFVSRIKRGEVMMREVKWSSPEVPRSTAISFSLLPALALQPLITKVLHLLTSRSHRITENTRIESDVVHYKVFLISAMVFNILAFLCSYFSKSLNREFGMPALAFLTIPAMYTLSVAWGKRITYRLTLPLLIILAFIANWATPATVPWYKDYTRITIAWRSSFYEYYLQSLHIIKFYSFFTPLTIYSRDKTCLGYASMMLYDISIPKNLIKVYSLQALSRYDINIIYNSIDLLIEL